MSDVHLSKERWADLLAGRIPVTARPALLEHLEAPCDVCERFLAEAAERGEIDALDGLADEALLAIAAKKDEAVDDLSFARIDRAIRLRSARRWLRPLVAVAAVALVAFFIQRMPSPESTSREKGVAPGLEGGVKLRVLRSHEGRLLPIDAGSVVSPGDALVFEIELARASCVTLQRAQGAAREKLLDAPLCLAQGKHVVERGGRALGLPLTRDDKGELTITASIERGQDASVTVIVVDASGAP
jgi:hypothetical protein